MRSRRERLEKFEDLKEPDRFDVTDVGGPLEVLATGSSGLTGTRASDTICTSSSESDSITMIRSGGITYRIGGKGSWPHSGSSSNSGLASVSGFPLGSRPFSGSGLALRLGLALVSELARAPARASTSSSSLVFRGPFVNLRRLSRSSLAPEPNFERSIVAFVEVFLEVFLEVLLEIFFFFFFGVDLALDELVELDESELVVEADDELDDELEDELDEELDDELDDLLLTFELLRCGVANLLIPGTADFVSGLELFNSWSLVFDGGVLSEVSALHSVDMFDTASELSLRKSSIWSMICFLTSALFFS